MDRSQFAKSVPNSTVLGELHDDWAVVRRYMTLEVQQREELPKLEAKVERAA